MKLKDFNKMINSDFEEIFDEKEDLLDMEIFLRSDLSTREDFEK